MTREQVREILDRVLSWPPERQADVVRVVKLMEEQDASRLQLTDEQMAEVRQHLAHPNPKFVTLEEARERFARRRASGSSSARPHTTTSSGYMHGSPKIGHVQRMR
jgi:hypothetical protein